MALSKRWELKRELDDYRMGVVTATVANCHRNPKSRPTPFEPKDFMPDYSGAKTKKKSPEELKFYWETVVVPAFNSKAKREKQRLEKQR